MLPAKLREQDQYVICRLKVNEAKMNNRESGSHARTMMDFTSCFHVVRRDPPWRSNFETPLVVNRCPHYMANNTPSNERCFEYDKL